MISLLSLYVYIPLILLNANFILWIKWLISLIILIAIGSISKYLFIAVYLFELLINVVILHIYFHWGNYSIEAAFDLIVSSPKREAFEYIKSFVGISDIFIFIYVVLGFWFIFVYFKNNHEKIPKKYKYISALGLLFIIVSIMSRGNTAKKIYPYYLIKVIYHSGKWTLLSKKRNEFLKRLNLYYNKNFKYNNIVIVIGESVNRHHMSVYGYHEDTTPFFGDLVKNYKSDKLCIFKKIYSPANQTRFAIPLEFTEATSRNYYKFFKSPSLITLFKNAGYTTYWLSNQEEFGRFNLEVTSISRESNFTFVKHKIHTNSSPQDKDIDLLPVMKKINLTDNNFIVFHLEGSHFNYSLRYEHNSSLIKSPKNIIDDYDNSIYYTDSILLKIFDYFKKMNRPFLFVYLSDHSEYLGTNHGHGHTPDRAHKEEYDIPFIVYSSIHNRRLENLCVLNNKTPFNMQHFYDIILYLNGYKKDLPKKNR